MLLMITLAITGCGGGSSNEVIRTDIHTGHAGLDLEFLKNQPVPKIYAGESFQIGIRAINKGAYDAKNAIVRISGDPGYITFEKSLSAYDRFNLDGKTNYDPRDKQESIIFTAESSFADKGFKEHDSMLIVNACYDYHNTLSTQVCIDPDIYDQRPDEKNCDVKILSFGGQGGPVGVSQIESRMSTDNDAIYPRFKITITNFGPGEVFTKGKSDEFCSSDKIKTEDINYIKLTKFEFSEIALDDMKCIPSKDKVKLKNKKGTITCTLKEGSPKRLKADTSSYTTNLLVEFDYGYSSSQTKIVTIINEE